MAIASEVWLAAADENNCVWVYLRRNAGEETLQRRLAERVIDWLMIRPVGNVLHNGGVGPGYWILCRCENRAALIRSLHWI